MRDFKGNVLHKDFFKIPYNMWTDRQAAGCHNTCISVKRGANFIKQMVQSTQK